MTNGEFDQLGRSTPIWSIVSVDPPVIQEHKIVSVEHDWAGNIMHAELSDGGCIGLLNKGQYYASQQSAVSALAWRDRRSLDQVRKAYERAVANRSQFMRRLVTRHLKGSSSLEDPTYPCGGGDLP